MNERRHYSKAFRIEAVRLLSLGEQPASQLARELGVRRNQLNKWRDQVSAKGETAFSGLGRYYGDSALNLSYFEPAGQQLSALSP